MIAPSQSLFAGGKSCRYLVGCFLLALLVPTGCEDSNQSTARPAAPVTPEVRYERFINEFRRRVEEDTIHPNSFAAAGSSAQWSMTVEDELHPPETEEGVYRATIKVISKSSFTVITLPDEGEEAGKEDDEDSKGQFELGTSEEILAGDEKVGGPRGFPASPLQTYEPKASETVYELVFVNDKWRLKTKPDPAEEQFVTEAFNLALSRQ